LYLKLRQDCYLDLDTWMIDFSTIRPTRTALEGRKNAASALDKLTSSFKAMVTLTRMDHCSRIDFSNKGTALRVKHQLNKAPLFDLTRAG